jgi:D-alanine-D-alanine ligase
MSDQVGVVLVFGGRSAEHDVSILSARSIYAETSKDRFSVTPICVARDGLFVEPERSQRILAGVEPGHFGDPDFAFETWWRKSGATIVFPIIHGTYGEDGTLQGYLEMLGIPYVGSGVTASAVGMDKSQMKSAFAHAGLPIAEFLVIQGREWQRDALSTSRRVCEAIPFPLFVKPANGGSSVGVTRVTAPEGLADAITYALRFDEKVMVERGIDARELEVSVLGNTDLEASVPGEVVPGGEFYDYSDKYIDGKARLYIPAELPDVLIREVRSLSIAAYTAVGAAGYARVDSFLDKHTGQLYVNEINTIPGFTKISMYPKLWAATGLQYAELISRLIELGLELHRFKSKRFESTMKFFDEVPPLT